MIIRQWTGLAKKDREAAYLRHFRDEVLPRLESLAGFAGATVLRRELPEGIQVTVQTRWDSMAAIRKFAGVNLVAAVVADEAKPVFVSFDAVVSHYEVVLTSPPR